MIFQYNIIFVNKSLLRIALTLQFLIYCTYYDIIMMLWRLSVIPSCNDKATACVNGDHDTQKYFNLLKIATRLFKKNMFEMAVILFPGVNEWMLHIVVYIANILKYHNLALRHNSLFCFPNETHPHPHKGNGRKVTFWLMVQPIIRLKPCPFYWSGINSHPQSARGLKWSIYIWDILFLQVFAFRSVMYISVTLIKRSLIWK